MFPNGEGKLRGKIRVGGDSWSSLEIPDLALDWRSRPVSFDKIHSVGLSRV